MKGKIVISRFWTRLFSLGKAKGVTVFPFIFLFHSSYIQDEVLINHERIHIRQAIEMAIVPFYIWYIVEFVIRYLRFWDFNKAYLSISFEKEAYAKEKDLNYLSTRSFWGFSKYL